MLKNIIVTALRIFKRNKTFVFINIMGLAIGIGGFLVLAAYVQSEWAFDKFHQKSDRVYRVVETQRLPGVEEMDVAITMPPLAPLMKQHFPEVQSYVRLMSGGSSRWDIDGEQFTVDRNLFFADSSLFDIFTFPLLAGDPETALIEPNSVVLNRSTADRIFGDDMFPDRIIGKQINLVRGGRLFPFEITGIMKDIPDHSHLRLSVVISYSTLEKYNENFNQRWGNSLMTYLLLEEHADVERLEAKFPQFLDDIIPENSVWAGDKLDLYLQPLDEIHLESGHIKYQIQNYQKGDLSSIYIFGFVSLLVILVACFNYVNLSTARAFQRAEEVGIRKIFGSARSSLIAQFLVESIILAGVASLIGLLMAWYALPPFKDLMELQVPFYLFETEYLLPGIGLLILLVGLAAGSYPAFFLSSFEPVQTLKGKYYGTSSGAFLRKFLVTTQFAVVATLFIVSGYIWNQMEYVAEKNMGFNKEDVMYISLQTRDARTHIPLIKQQLSQVNGVRSISAASHYLPSGSGDMTLQVPSVDNPQSLLVRNSIVDPSYVETMGMELVVGRDFSEDIGADTVSSILVNETLVQRLGWEDPVGKQLQSGNGEDATLYTVIGVVNDFNYFSLRESIDPLIMRARPSGLSYLMIRIEDTEISNTVSELRSVFKELVPEQTFDYTFLDDRMATMYQSDRNYGKLIAAFAGLSIIIACMGLLGITAFVVEQKTKEIGIRKVLGSSRSQIMLLVTKPFLKLSGVALLIAVPAGYWLGNRWLDKFQYFDRPGVLIYLVSAFAIFLITYLTVSFHTYKASNLNPVDAIRSE